MCLFHRQASAPIDERESLRENIMKAQTLSISTVSYITIILFKNIQLFFHYKVSHPIFHYPNIFFISYEVCDA